MCLVVSILGMAGLFKLADPESFALAISNYSMLPRQLLQPLAYVLPMLEIVAALALLVPSYRRAGWVLASLLFAVFAGAVGTAVARGLDVSCGCFGSAMTVSWYHLAGNLLLLSLCLWAFRREPQQPVRALPAPRLTS